MLCTLEWRITFHEAEIQALPAIGLDHSPLVLRLHFEHKKRKRYFKMEAFWIEHEEYHGVIHQIWNQTASQLATFSEKLKETSKELTKWSKEKYAHAPRRIKELTQTLTEITNQPIQHTSRKEAQSIIHQIDTLRKQEEQYWGLRSCIKWLQWGDKNTRFFHATTVQRRHRNNITMLQVEDNRWYRDPVALRNHIQSFYSNLYKTEGPRNYQPVLNQCHSPVDENINTDLMANLTLEEVRAVVFQLGALKAPGPDGFNRLFYQNSWEILKTNLLQLVQNFFNIGILDPLLNQTYISLIPKVKNPKTIGQFRPISLCNFSYKIISKLLANRLKKSGCQR